MRRVHQLDTSDCGPACLAMIAGHYGRQVSMTQMRERAGTDRNSTNLTGLIEAAESVGLNAQAVKGEAGSLTPEVPVPCVAHVTEDSQYHFVVLYKIGKDRVWVADPDPLVGKTTYSLSEFYDMWTGYLVLVSRGESFRKGMESPGLFGRFLPTLKPHVGTIVNTVVASIVLTISRDLGHCTEGLSGMHHPQGIGKIPNDFPKIFLDRTGGGGGICYAQLISKNKSQEARYESCSSK